MPSETVALETRLELEQTAGEWIVAYVVTSPSFPKGKNEARVTLPQPFNSKDDAIQHAIREFAQTIGEHVGAGAQMRS